MTNGQTIKICDDTNLRFEDGQFHISQRVACDQWEEISLDEDEFANLIEIGRKALEGEE